MPLPTKKTPVTSDLEKLVWLLYGPPKIGKTTFTSKFESPVFGTTEDAHRHLEIYNRPIKDWPDFKLFVREVNTSAGKIFKTVIIDTVINLYKMCVDYVCLKKGLESPGDEGYGVGWGYVNDEFAKEINSLRPIVTGKGLVFICHYKQMEIKGRGIKYTKTAPKLPGGCWGVIGPMVDIIAYAGFDVNSMDRRVLVTQPREDLEAGFRLPDGSRPLPGTLPLSYQAVKEAWLKRGQAAAAPASTGPKKIVAPTKGIVAPRRIVK